MSNEKKTQNNEFKVYTCTTESIISLAAAYEFWKKDPKSVDAKRGERFSRIKNNKLFEDRLYQIVADAKEDVAPAVDFNKVCPNGQPVYDTGKMYWSYCIICWARRWWSGGVNLGFRADATHES